MHIYILYNVRVRALVCVRVNTCKRIGQDRFLSLWDLQHLEFEEEENAVCL